MQAASPPQPTNRASLLCLQAERTGMMDRRPGDDGADPSPNKQDASQGQPVVDVLGLDGGGAAFILALVVLGLVSGETLARA